MRWNPFGPLFESMNYPLARIRRSGFFERISDTFTTFYGSFNPLEKVEEDSEYGDVDVTPSQMGLLDYIFPVGRITHAIAQSENDALSMTCGVVFAFPLNAIKFIAALSLTAVLSPFVLVGHFLYSCFSGSELRRQAENLQITTLNDASQGKVSLASLFGKYRDAEQRIVISPEATPENQLLAISVKDHCPCTTAYMYYSTVKRTNLGTAKIDAENATAIKALLKLNLFNTTQNLEQHGVLGQVETRLVAGPSLL